jgi:hypothetical protein
MDVQLGFGHAGYEISQVHGKLFTKSSTSTTIPSIDGFEEVRGRVSKLYRVVHLGKTICFGQSAAHVRKHINRKWYSISLDVGLNSSGTSLGRIMHYVDVSASCYPHPNPHPSLSHPQQPPRLDQRLQDPLTVQHGPYQSQSYHL